ncbi:rhodanese-like domain-containing protein [Legionella spiritensis]|uniref:rhodanese-like domain-containing protein n=1 Tax=Legionella spiritensis TaxID=452 RepID=UPI000F6F3F89|nr:rhodanese-like domain-containing protein [Legionella spiritensis]VEG92355.1 Rhodanese domain protein [Legionella spiritensis]
MTEQTVATIDVHELKKRMDTKPDICLIDVREIHEWQALRIPGAVHIPKDDIAGRIHDTATDKNQPVYLHCKGGVRSLHAAEVLTNMGYTKVYSVNGGIMEWAMCGYPVEE